MAFGRKPFSAHPDITVGRVNAKLYIFIPKASPVDFEYVKQLYTAQKASLTAA